jgi:hypothetical protein
MVLRRLRVTRGDKPFEIALVVLGKFWQVKLPYLTEQCDLVVCQFFGHLIASGSAQATIRAIADGGNNPRAATLR